MDQELPRLHECWVLVLQILQIRALLEQLHQPRQSQHSDQPQGLESSRGAEDKFEDPVKGNTGKEVNGEPLAPHVVIEYFPQVLDSDLAQGPNVVIGREKVQNQVCDEKDVHKELKEPKGRQVNGLVIKGQDIRYSDGRIQDENAQDHLPSNFEVPLVVDDALVLLVALVGGPLRWEEGRLGLSL